MAAPTRKPAGLPLDCFLHAEPPDEAELDRLAAQGQRNREYLARRWEELLREHRGEWVIVYGDRQMVVGDEYRATITGRCATASSLTTFAPASPSSFKKSLCSRGSSDSVAAGSRADSRTGLQTNGVLLTAGVPAWLLRPRYPEDGGIEMAAPSRQRFILPQDAFLRKEPIDPDELTRLFEQHERNRDYFYSRRDELFRDHRGQYVIVYDDDKMMIGDDLLQMCKQVDLDDLCTAFVEFIDDPLEFPSVWL